MENILEVRNLRKSYKKFEAVKGISFNVKKGEVLGLLGPNGAGKSTTISILSTILKPTAGEINFLGQNVKKNVSQVKKNIGIVPQDLAIYEDIPTIQNVRFFASLYGLRGRELDDKVKEALEFVQLYDKKDHKPKTFSGGMKRRLNIACAIAHNPKLIIMDEPTVGIDPQSRNHILESIKKLQARGATVIYTTHYMEEVEEISDRIIIMDHGTIIAEGTKEELKRQVDDERTYSVSLDGIERLKKSDFFKIEGVKDVSFEDKKVRITTLNTVENLDKIIALVLNSRCKIKNISSSEASLETVFLNLTGRTLRE